ncbi:helix-turn-helix domain-containing protein [Nocardia sp. NPDC051030]|uniref:winged helix-turn-helix transcriptional regulator n=1 Tax=Nocardia sp. NPDC051030 TaxID=3155162 RepID=UPI00341EC05B
MSNNPAEDLTQRFHADAGARAFALLGDKWTLLILRESVYGVRRFGQFARNLGIPRPTLSARLSMMVETGLLDRVRYQDDPERFEYRATQASRDLFPAAVMLTHWGDTYLASPEGPAIVLRHHECGEPIDPALICRTCGKEINTHNVTAEPGPAFADTEPDIQT